MNICPQKRIFRCTFFFFTLNENEVDNLLLFREDLNSYLEAIEVALKWDLMYNLRIMYN